MDGCYTSNQIFYYFLIFFNFFEIFLSGVAGEGKTEIELRIYHKNFSRNGQPSEKLCLKLTNCKEHMDLTGSGR